MKLDLFTFYYSNLCLLLHSSIFPHKLCNFVHTTSFINYKIKIVHRSCLLATKIHRFVFCWHKQGNILTNVQYGNRFWNEVFLYTLSSQGVYVMLNIFIFKKTPQKTKSAVRKDKNKKTLLCMIWFSLLGDVPDCEPAALAQHHIKFFVP